MASHFEPANHAGYEPHQTYFGGSWCYFARRSRDFGGRRSLQAVDRFPTTGVHASASWRCGGVRIRSLLPSTGRRRTMSSKWPSIGGRGSGTLCFLFGGGDRAGARCWIGKPRIKDGETGRCCEQDCSHFGKERSGEECAGGSFEEADSTTRELCPFYEACILFSGCFKQEEESATFQPSRSRSGGSRSTSWCRQREPAADGAAHHDECEGEEGERSESTCSAPWRSSFRRRRSRWWPFRRFWVGGAGRSFCSYPVKAGRYHGVADGGQKEEDQFIEAGSSSGCCEFWESRWTQPWFREEGISSPPGPSRSLSGAAEGDLSDHREVAFRRLEQCHVGAGYEPDGFQRPCMGGIQVKNRVVQSICSLCMERRRDHRFPSKWPCGSSTRSGVPSSFTAGSICSRSRELATISRALFRGLAAFHIVIPAPSSEPSSGRAALLTALRASVGRDHLGVPAGAGRLCSTSSQCWSGLKDEGRGRRSRSQKETKVEGKSKGSGRRSRVGGGDDFLHVKGNDDDAKRRECVKLPGSMASSIRVPALLNSMPRMLLQTKCSFQGFLQTLVSTRGIEEVPTSMVSSSVWPMPMPYPEVFAGGAATRISNCHLKRLVCLQVAVFDWLSLGSPLHAPAMIKMGMKLSASQWSAVRMLEHLAVDGNTPEFVDAGDMGRSAGKVEDLEEHLSVLSRAFSDLHAFEGGYWAAGGSRPFEEADCSTPLRCGEAVGRSEKEAVISAKPLISDRLQFPAAPSFDPVPYFDESTASRYEKPRSLGKVPSDVEENPPVVQIRADKYNRMMLFKKLAESGRLRMIPHDSFHSNYRSGMFSVVKDQHRDRLILDGRPANLLDRSQSKWCRGMASSSALGGIFLGDNADLVICGEDLKDFFYQFSVNDERTCRNALACDLSVQEAEEIFEEVQMELAHKGRIFVGFSSLAMGDVCAVEYAQCAHLSLLLQKKVCHQGELLTLRGAVPRGLLQVGVIVDDLVILEQVVRGSCHQSEGYERCLRARKAYTSVGLENNPKKSIEKQTLARFWGIELDGKKGLLRCSSLRLWPITAITLRVMRLGLATVGLLEALAGSWVALLGVRRLFLAFLMSSSNLLESKTKKSWFGCRTSSPPNWWWSAFWDLLQWWICEHVRPLSFLPRMLQEVGWLGFVLRFLRRFQQKSSGTSSGKVFGPNYCHLWLPEIECMVFWLRKTSYPIRKTSTTVIPSGLHWLDLWLIEKPGAVKFVGQVISMCWNWELTCWKRKGWVGTFRVGGYLMG